MSQAQAELDARNDKMLNTPIPKLIIKLSTPTIASMLITAIYNMADTYFVSQISQSASAAVGVVLSLMLIIQAIGFTLGVGSGSNIARLLGANNDKSATNIASTGFFTSVFVGFIFMVFGLLFLDPLVRVLGSTDTIAPYAKDYTQYILIGTPFMTAAFVLNNILRSQGNAFWSMIGLTAGGILNIILDPIFIFALGMGTGGAALATTISQFVSFSILLFMTMRHGAAHISLKAFRITLLKKILPVGLPSFYRQGLTSLATILLNVAAGANYPTDAAIAAMSIVSRITGFCFSALIGFYQGFQPVCGFNYGAKRYDRVREAMLYCMKIASIALTLIAILVFAFSPTLIGLFRPGDTEVIEIGTLALRLQAIMLPSTCFAMMANMAFQALGMSSKAAILAIARQGLFFVPLILVLPPLFGLLGVQMAQPLADLLTLALSIPFLMIQLKDLKNQSIRNAA